MVTSIESRAPEGELQKTPVKKSPPDAAFFYKPGQFIAPLSDALRLQGFLLAENSVQIIERLNRLNPVGLQLSRTVVLSTVAADLISSYQTLQQRARWFPWLVEPEDWEWLHKIGANRVVETATSLGGALIKAGQFASTRPDLLPPAYIERLATLQDKVPPLPWPVIEERLREELGRPLDTVFSRIDQTPVASASLSQVHQAWLKDGRKVALKIQYPQIQEVIKADIDMLDLLSKATAPFTFGNCCPPLGITSKKRSYSRLTLSTRPK